MKLKHLLGIGAAVAVIHVAAPHTVMQAAQAQTYSNNFDTNTAGALPPGWVNIGSSSYQVVTAGSVSSPNALGEATYADGDAAIYTGQSISGNMVYHVTEKLSYASGVQNNANQSLVIYADSTFQNGIMVNPNWNTGTIYAYNKTSGNFAQLSSSVAYTPPASGTNVNINVYAISGTLSIKIWPVGTAEPTAVTGSWADSAFTSGYCGLRTGLLNATPVPADDISFGPATSTAAAPAGTVYAATNTLIHYSPLNWHPAAGNSAEMETNDSMASFTTKQSGSTTQTLAFDTNGLTPSAPIQYRVDNLPEVVTTIPTDTSPVTLTVTLPDTGVHTVKTTLIYFPQTSNRWGSSSAAPLNVARLISVTPGSGGTLSAVTGLPSQVFLTYSDSRGNAATTGNALNSFSNLVAQGLGMEPADRSFESMGWSVVNATGDQAGDIVPFYTPGNDALSAWNKYDGRNSLLSGGLYPASLGGILDGFGVNDTRANTPGVSSAPSAANGTDAQVTASVSGVLPLQRTAAGASVPIFVLLDFSGDKRAAVTAGYNAYEAATPDPRCYLLDIGTIAGLTDNGASYLSVDGVHPNQYGQSIVTAKIVQAIQAKLASGGTKRKVQ